MTLACSQRTGKPHKCKEFISGLSHLPEGVQYDVHWISNGGVFQSIMWHPQLYDDYDRSEKDDHMMMMVIIIMMMIVVMNRWQYQWSSVACTSGLLSKLSSPLVRFWLCLRCGCWCSMFMIAKLSSPIKNMRNENADVASVSEDDDRWMTMVTLLLML